MSWGIMTLGDSVEDCHLWMSEQIIYMPLERSALDSQCQDFFCFTNYVLTFRIETTAS